ncbi:hypothetical protein [Streptomyces griseofuscus]|uniref:hypothetical protein n=1 Tax=Streptomyces griseofuscus TaxID=146922 RepID=UPI003F4CCAD8
MKTTKIGAVMSGDVVTAQHGTPFKDVVRLLRDHGKRPWKRPQSTRTRAWSLSTRNLLPVTVPTPPRKVSSAGQSRTAGRAAES